MKYLIFMSICSFVLCSSSIEAYTQKSPYQEYGQPSKINGLPKTKPIKGYTKQTSKGYVRVNPYSRSRT